MVGTVIQKLQTSIAGGAVIIGTASVISRVLGLIRDRLLFSTFGAGPITDSYYAAFKLPDLIFNILILGALSSAFIPVFVSTWANPNAERRIREADAWRVANSVLNVIIVALLALGIIFFLLAPQLVPLIAPGFDEEQLRVTIQLTRIMLIAILFFGASNLMSAVLNSFKRFFAYSLAPIFYNVGIIVGITMLYPVMGMNGLAWGVVFGAALHLLVQLPAVAHTGFRYQAVMDFRHRAVRRIARLIVPRTFGLAVQQADLLVSTIIASTLAAGSISIYNAAQNIQSLPINVIGVSLAIAAFPYFSEAFAENDGARFVRHFSQTIRRILYFVIPASVLLLLLRAQVVRVVLGAGAFDWEDTVLTAQTLGFFVLSLFAQSLIPTLARSFYALHDTRTPVTIGVIAVCTNIAGSLILSRVIGVLGLALSFSVSSLLHMLLLYGTLHRRRGGLDDERILSSTAKIVTASLVMGLVVWGTLRIVALGVNMQTFVGIFLQGAVSGIVGISVYFLITAAFRFDEVHDVVQWFKNLRGQLINGSRHE